VPKFIWTCYKYRKRCICEHKITLQHRMKQAKWNMRNKMNKGNNGGRKNFEEKRGNEHTHNMKKHVFCRLAQYTVLGKLESCSINCATKRGKCKMRGISREWKACTKGPERGRSIYADNNETVWMCAHMRVLWEKVCVTIVIWVFSQHEKLKIIKLS